MELTSDTEQQNYLRLFTILLDTGTSAIRDKFEHYVLNGDTVNDWLWEHISEDLERYKNNNAKPHITNQQWKKMFPSRDNCASTCEDFDITLMVLLMSLDFVDVERPSGNWRTAPKPSDRSWQANCVRLRDMRNELAHNATPTMTVEEYEKRYNILKIILNDMGREIPESDSVTAMRSKLQLPDNAILDINENIKPVMTSNAETQTAKKKSKTCTIL